MKTFAHVDAQGRILAISSAPDHAEGAPDMIEIHVPAGINVSGYTHSFINGVLVPVPSFLPTGPDAIEQRREAYPPIGDQLDALWHAMDAGVLPKVAGFYDRISEVKVKFPKPGGGGG